MSGLGVTADMVHIVIMKRKSGKLDAMPFTTRTAADLWVNEHIMNGENRLEVEEWRVVSDLVRQ